jgi:hypothetical protein
VVPDAVLRRIVFDITVLLVITIINWIRMSVIRRRYWFPPRDKNAETEKIITARAIAPTQIIVALTAVYIRLLISGKRRSPITPIPPKHTPIVRSR